MRRVKNRSRRSIPGLLLIPALFEKTGYHLGVAVAVETGAYFQPCEFFPPVFRYGRFIFIPGRTQVILVIRILLVPGCADS